jgi:hypothetical protein
MKQNRPAENGTVVENQTTCMLLLLKNQVNFAGGKILIRRGICPSPKKGRYDHRNGGGRGNYEPPSGIEY